MLLAPVLPALVLLALVFLAPVLPAPVLPAPVLLLQIQGQCITSTTARNTLLGVEFTVRAGSPECYDIRDMSNGHSRTVFRVLCKKISTGREKLAPIDWHDWHVFATLQQTWVELAHSDQEKA